MIRPLSKINRLASKAFTLVELVISIVIISIALIGTLLATSLTSKYSANPEVYLQAAALGQAYLDEIMTKDFPTGFPCASPPVGGRSQYTNVCDYQSLSDSGAHDMYGNAITGLGSYNIAVNIDGTTGTFGGLTAGTQIVRVDVTVTRNGMPTYTFSSYRTKY